MRGTADYFQGLSRHLSMEDELDQMKLQLRQAISHCTQDRDELDRLRKMLQSERDTSVRRDQEIEQMQQSNAEEIRKLNENLTKAEKVFMQFLCLSFAYTLKTWIAGPSRSRSEVTSAAAERSRSHGGAKPPKGKGATPKGDEQRIDSPCGCSDTDSALVSVWQEYIEVRSIARR
jgi:hypothetical protein